MEGSVVPGSSTPEVGNLQKDTKTNIFERRGEKARTKLRSSAEAQKNV